MQFATVNDVLSFHKILLDVVQSNPPLRIISVVGQQNGMDGFENIVIVITIDAAGSGASLAQVIESGLLQRH